MARCELTGKGPVVKNKVSHSNIKTKFKAHFELKIENLINQLRGLLTQVLETNLRQIDNLWLDLRTNDVESVKSKIAQLEITFDAQNHKIQLHLKNEVLFRQALYDFDNRLKQCMTCDFIPAAQRLAKLNFKQIYEEVSLSTGLPSQRSSKLLNQVSTTDLNLRKTPILGQLETTNSVALTKSDVDLFGSLRKLMEDTSKITRSGWKELPRVLSQKLIKV